MAFWDALGLMLLSSGGIGWLAILLGMGLVVFLLVGLRRKYHKFKARSSLRELLRREPTEDEVLDPVRTKDIYARLAAELGRGPTGPELDLTRMMQLSEELESIKRTREEVESEKRMRALMAFLDKRDRQARAREGLEQQMGRPPTDEEFQKALNGETRTG